MSVAATTAVWKLVDQNDNLTTRDICILFVLADTAGDDMHAWPSIDTISKKLRMSRRNIIRSLNHLIKIGVLERVEWYRDNGSQSTNVYRLLFVAQLGLTTTSTNKVPREMGFDGARKASLLEERDDTVSQVGCHGVTPRSDVVSHPEPKERTQLEPNTSINTSIIKLDTPKESSDDDVYWKIVEAWNQNCGSLSKVKTLNTPRRKQLKTFLRDMGSPQEAYAVMAIAAREVSMDPFWQRRGFGFNNIMADQRVVQKAETAYNRGSFDHEQAEIDRMLAAIGGNDA